MTRYNLNIDKYVVFYYAGSRTPEIELYDTATANIAFGRLIFKPNGATLPPNTVVNMAAPPGFRCITLYYHLEDFQNVIDVLRNEKPLRFFYESPALPTVLESAIATGLEPVGEAEE